MKFLRLPDPLLSVLFEDEDILAIDKPYGFNSHTNDSKIEHSDFIQDGLIEMLEKQRGKKLHIIHRLDQTTTGVIIFGKSVESAKKYAEYFFERKVKKTYWFITGNKSTKSDFLIDLTIIHKAKELEAKTQLKLLKKSSQFELWQANPYTGRNHQIRIHASAAQIPILGDRTYGGLQFPFICLHNHRIEFPNGIAIESKPPSYFEDLKLLEDLTIAKALFEIDRRYRLFSEQAEQCFRLVHSRGSKDELGFSLDQFGSQLVLNWHNEFWDESEKKKITYLSQRLKKPIVVRLPKSQVLIEPQGSKKKVQPVWRASEKSVHYELRSEAMPSAGLFLNQRLQRNWIKQHSKNKLVLNLFSQNCTFAVAAALGKADQVVSVDSSKAQLAWGKKNFEINALESQNYKFLLRDSLPFLKQCFAKNIKYDLIICDAPSFVRGEKGIFKIETELDALIKNALQCLNENAQLLFSTAADGILIEDIKRSVLKAQKEVQIPMLEINSILPALDFELPHEKMLLKSFLINLL